MLFTKQNPTSATAAQRLGTLKRALLPFILVNFIALGCNPSWAQEAAPESAPEADAPQHSEDENASPKPPDASQSGDMSAERLGDIIQLIDPDAVAQGNSWQFQFQERPLFLVYDNSADRMRLMSPVAEAEQLDEALLYRMLQANYDAVLDPRYAIARGIVWSAFIHPLSSLRDEQFASAVVQVFTAAETFGTSFSSGGIVFGGGDSQEQHRRLLESLRKLLNPST